MTDPTSARSEPRRRRGETKPPLLATPRPNANALAEERAQLDADLAELRATEANLRAYEARIRAMQAELDTALRAATTRAPRGTIPPVRSKAATNPPFRGGGSELQAEWDKLIRAREILEHEQAHLRGDRLALKDEAAVLRRRAAALDDRETNLAERERALLEAEASTEARATDKSDEEKSADTSPHLIAKLTMAPFAMGRSLLSRPKAKP